ncbi:hypothetical protein BGZ90_009273 [Linnemannia elongata]|nr:hypothetical protein BGZ90_009273 [Linnemannia elongata]
MIYKLVANMTTPVALLTAQEAMTRTFTCYTCKKVFAFPNNSLTEYCCMAMLDKYSSQDWKYRFNPQSYEGKWSSAVQNASLD